MDIRHKDRKLIWHPFTQEKTADLPIVINKAKGSYVYDEKGKKYLDLISSWWVNLHGHSNPIIAESIYQQALELEHIIFAGFTHEPAVKLCDYLSKYLPNNLSKFFFSDNGSTSTEIALKIAYQYWYNLGYTEKKLFLCFEGGYHGDTFGAMSVGSSGFHTPFEHFFFDRLVIPYPDTWDDDKNIDIKEAKALKILDVYLNRYSDKIAAIILEPLIQGASGMRVCRAKFLNLLLKKIKKENILIIYDEIMTGFGRTGTLFALEQLDIFPDILCLSKGITGGFLPLALTITTQKIYNTFLHDEWKYAFAHGHSYTANPLACSAAISSLELTINVLNKKKLHEINQIHLEGIDQLKQSSMNIIHTRILGTISAFSLTNINEILPNLQNKLKEKGLLLRPLKNTIYLLPPYSITNGELANAYSKIIEIINTI